MEQEPGGESERVDLQPPHFLGRPRPLNDIPDGYPQRTATGTVLAALVFLLGAVVYARHSLLVMAVFLALTGLTGAAGYYMYKKDMRRARLDEDTRDDRR